MKKVKFSIDEREFFNEATHNFLTERCWQRKKSEEGIIYVKEGTSNSTTNFLDKPKKSNLPFLEELIKDINNFFIKKNYLRRVENNISINDTKDTFLIGAGIQYFRKCFWDNDLPEEGKFFIPQPVIRVKYANSVKQGVTSSFVNQTTVQLLNSFYDHLSSLDDWFDLFSAMGLYMGDFNLRFVPSDRYGKGKKSNWASTDGFSISINYLNLNIGDAGYIRVPTKKNGNLNISDIGFGLERILWALYKTPSYFDIISPKSESKYSRFRLVDSIRSATLLAMSNIQEGTQDAYNQFRKFTKTASQYYGLFDSFNLINHYYDFWSKFILPQKNMLESYSFLAREIFKEISNE